MVDIVIDDITNTGGTGIFDRLMAAVDERIAYQYQNNRITGSDYANVYLGSIQSVLQAAVQYNLQEQLTEAQVDLAIADNLLKAKQLEIADKELDIKLTESNRLRGTTQAELEKQWGYAVTRDVNGDLVLGASDDGGRIDKEILKITEDINVAVEQVGIAKAQSSKEYAAALATIDKEFGFNYSLGVDGYLDRSSLTDAADGKIDYEVTNLQKQGVLLDAQKQTVYSQRVLSDKQAAKLGLDNVMKLSETARANDTNYVYTPWYEEV